MRNTSNYYYKVKDLNYEITNIIPGSSGTTMSYKITIPNYICNFRSPFRH